MKAARIFARLMTLTFGITAPRPEQERRYALISIALLFLSLIAMLIVFEVIVPLTLGR